MFGVMSSAVTARQRELGIRLALGARAGQVLRLVLARASTLVAIGGIAGLMLSWWATTLVASLDPAQSCAPNDGGRPWATRL